MNKLEKLMYEIFENKVEQYDNNSDAIRGYYNNEFAPIYGGINELIYFYQTLAIFKKYPIEILEFLNSYELEFTISADDDPTRAINNAVWCAFELYASRFIDDLDYEEIEEEEEEEE